MKKIYLLSTMLCLCHFLFAQNIVAENLGTPSGTTAIATYTGWQNNGVFTFTRGGAANPADVRATSVSSGYTGASGSGNVFFTSTSGEYGFAIEGINASVYNTIKLQYGYRKESGSLHAAFSVEYWNGTAWVVLANTTTDLFNEAGNASTGWYLAKELSLPVAAQIDGLRIRFVKSGTASIRVDDIKLTGLINDPTTTSISPNATTVGAAAFTLTVNGANYISGQSTVTWNGSNRTTTFVNSGQLTAAIPATDLGSAGTANVGVTTTGATNSSNTQPFTINASSGPTITLATPLPDFGNVCINNTAGPNAFVINGNGLDGTDIVLSAVNGFSYSETSGGTYTSTLNIAYTGTSFTNRSVYVKFDPLAVQSYSSNINLNGGGGIVNYPVPVLGVGINTAPTVTTGASSSITPVSAVAAGSIPTTGCTAISAYGIEYSTTNGFANGSGTQVAASNLSGGNFSSTITGLSSNTVYYYKAYATNAGGTVYGGQQTFSASPVPVSMSAQSNLTYTENFADITNWTDNFAAGNGANHFGSIGVTGASPIPSATITTTATNVFRTTLTSGGVQKGTIQSPSTQSIVLLSTGSPDNTTASAIDLFLDFTGVNAGTLSFDYETLNNSTGDRNGSLRVYESTNGTTFTELTNVLNFTNNVPISGSKANIVLPISFNNSATARLRFYYHNGSGGTGTGSRPKISIDNIVITALATTPCVSPTAPATSLTFGAINDVSIAGSFVAASPAVDQYMVVMSTSSTLTNTPVDGQIYEIGDNVGDGTVIAKGVSTSFVATGLASSTPYYFFIFPVNSVCTGGPLYYTTTVLNGTATTDAGLPPCVAPASQATALTFPTVGVNAIQGSFTATTASGYLVLISTSNSLSQTPVNGAVYNAGDILGNATVVQQSASTTFSVNELAAGTTYYFYIFSQNSTACLNGPAYLITAPLSASQATNPLPPCTAPLTQPTNITFKQSSTAASGAFKPSATADAYLVVVSTATTLSGTPVDNTDYAVGSSLGGGTVVSSSNANSFLAKNLTPGGTYYFFVFAASKTCTGGTKYLAAAPLTSNVTTTNTPLANVYFGNLHSHSDYSDGNQDNPGYTPALDYDYAKSSQCMDFLGIAEHNHFSTANNPGNQIANYHLGVAQADSVTAASTNFLALYGMEWGVISGGGHVLIYGDGMDDLWGWETGSGGWGPTNNYDVFVAKNAYTKPGGLFKTVNDNVVKNTFASLAHPNLPDFDSLSYKAYDPAADAAITATAVENGPSTSDNTTYSNPPSPMAYLSYYRRLLSKGYHLGPTIDHDNHKTTFGRTTYSRTAIVAPVLTETEIMKSMRGMNFYATQDCDTKVDFSINTQPMGSLFTDRYAPVISATMTDATTNLSAAVIRVMFGVPGSDVLAVKVDSAIGSSLLFLDQKLPNMSTGYYYLDISIGAARIITSPIWYTRNDIDGALPVTFSSFTAQKNNTVALLKWVTAQEFNSKEFRVERSADGIDWKTIAIVPAAGNSTSSIEYSVTDAQPVKGQNFYRIKQVDIDEKASFTAVRRVNFAAAFTYSIYPNPVKDVLRITTDNNTLLNADVKVMNTQGQLLINKKFNGTVQPAVLDVTSLNPGMYFLKIMGADGTSTVEKFVKQ